MCRKQPWWPETEQPVATTTPVAVLPGLALLSKLAHVTISHVAQQASERVFAKGEVVLHKDSAPSPLYFLLEGRLQGIYFTMDARKLGLCCINRGDYFGEVALADGRLQPEFITAVARSRVVFISGGLIEPILLAALKRVEAMCTRLAVRLREPVGQRRTRAVG